MNNRGNCLHQDGTSKKGKEFFAVQLQTPQNKSRSLSLRHLGKSDAEEVFHGFMESLGDVAERGEGDTDKNKDMVVASITSSVTDQCAVNGPVLQQIQAARYFGKEWSSLDSTEQATVVRIEQLYCKMHVFVNMVTECNTTLKNFLKSACEGKNLYGFTNSSEALPLSFLRISLCRGQ